MRTREAKRLDTPALEERVWWWSCRQHVTMKQLLSMLTAVSGAMLHSYVPYPLHSNDTKLSATVGVLYSA
jgi:hypothetical protein